MATTTRVAYRMADNARCLLDGMGCNIDESRSMVRTQPSGQAPRATTQELGAGDIACSQAGQVGIHDLRIKQNEATNTQVCNQVGERGL